MSSEFHRFALHSEQQLCLSFLLKSPSTSLTTCVPVPVRWGLGNRVLLPISCFHSSILARFPPYLAVSRSRLLSLSTVHVWGQTVLVWELTCVLQGVYRHPWPVLTRCQQLLLALFSIVTTKDASRHGQMLPGVPLGAKPLPVENHCSRLNKPFPMAHNLFFAFSRSSLSLSLSVYRANKEPSSWDEFRSHNYLVIVASVYTDKHLIS